MERKQIEEFLEVFDVVVSQMTESQIVADGQSLSRFVVNHYGQVETVLITCGMQEYEVFASNEETFDGLDETKVIAILSKRYAELQEDVDALFAELDAGILLSDEEIHRKVDQ